MLNERIDVDHRNGDQCSPKFFDFLERQEPADNFDTDDLVAVNRGAREKPGTFPAAVYHMDRHGHGGVGIETGDRNVNRHLGARWHHLAADFQSCLHAIRVPLYWFFPV